MITIELRLALFCLVLCALSFFLQKVIPGLGSMIFMVSVVSFFMSLVIYAYKRIFGALNDIFTIVAFGGMYIAGLGFVLGRNFALTAGALSTFAALAIKAAIIIFFANKEAPEEMEMQEGKVEQPTDKMNASLDGKKEG